MVRRHPVLAAWSQLLDAHAKASGVHLMLAKKFLFRPGQMRANAGIPDTGVVPRDRGTTGMDESFLERLARLRHNHLLAPLNQIPRLELLGLAGVEPPTVVGSADLDDIVHFAGRPLGPAQPARLRVPVDPMPLASAG
jgi:hypothetical protein